MIEEAENVAVAAGKGWEVYSYEIIFSLHELLYSRQAWPYHICEPQ